MKPGFEIRRSRSGSAAVVAVAGDIDLFTTPEVKRAIAEATATPGADVVIDLTATTFLDSCSLGVLIGAHRRLERHGRSLVVACDDEAIQKVFRVSGLDGIFEMAGAAPDDLAASR